MLRRFRFTFGVFAASLTLLATSVVLQGAASPSGAQGADPLAPVATAAGPVDLDTTQSSLRQQQAALAAELDVLQATADEVSRAIIALDANVAAQQESTNQAVTAANGARAGEAAAAAKVAEAQFEVDRVETMLRGMAVNLYVRPPVDDAVHAVINASPNDAPVRFALARYRVESVTDVLRAAEVARDELSKAEQLAAAATEQAEQAERAEQRKLADLQAARDQQLAFATEVNDRIDRDLFEAAMLAEQDAELSARMQAEELALAAQLRDSLARGEAVTIVIPVEATTTVPPTVAPEPEPVATTVVDTPAIDPSSQPGPPPATTVPPPPPTAPPTTAPPPPTTTPVTRTIVITPVTTTWVRGIEVSVAIAANTEAMLAAAERDGLLLTGSGYRNILDQIEIRREVCGPTDYDIWEKPSYECSPPVAIPGRSNHEKGVAIDFSGANGDLIRTRDHPAFQWLAGHAHLYGFFNLPSEPWHWSIDGR
ncbi:MAG: M15 family metallopeptidase [Acidimicrobiales bacterium]|nr:M15 family metallopeptidase [Acidimicrobiales bacterium]